MKRMLRLFAAVTAAAGLVWWLAAGANRGWTKTSVPTLEVDEITGLEFPVYVDRFVPGVELLAMFFAVAAGALAVSFFLRPRRAAAVSV